MLDWNEQKEPEEISSAVKINTSRKRKSGPETELELFEKTQRPHSCVLEETKEKMAEEKVKRRIVHLVMSGYSSDDSTDTEDSDEESPHCVIHGKNPKGLCAACQLCSGKNERCVLHRWMCRCGLKCKSRPHFRNHLKQFNFNEEVSNENDCFYSIPSIHSPEIRLKTIKFTKFLWLRSLLPHVFNFLKELEFGMKTGKWFLMKSWIQKTPS